jgi:hypothetical protein
MDPTVSPAVLARLAAEHAAPAVSADVVRVEMVEGKDEHAKFVIKVSSSADGYNAFHVRRRFRQFVRRRVSTLGLRCR